MSLIVLHSGIGASPREFWSERRSRRPEIKFRSADRHPRLLEILDEHGHQPLRDERPALIVEVLEGDEFTVLEARNRAIASGAFGVALDEECREVPSDV